MPVEFLGAAPQLLGQLIHHLVLIKSTVARYYHFNPTELNALALLATKGSLSFKHLRQSLSMPKSTLTAVVDSLEEKRVVERQRDPLDRRQWFVRLTPEGTHMVQKISEKEAEALAQSLRRMPPDQQEVMAQALDTLARMSPIL